MWNTFFTFVSYLISINFPESTETPLCLEDSLTLLGQEKFLPQYIHAHENIFINAFNILCCNFDSLNYCIMANSSSYTQILTQY